MVSTAIRQSVDSLEDLPAPGRLACETVARLSGLPPETARGARFARVRTGEHALWSVALPSRAQDGTLVLCVSEEATLAGGALFDLDGAPQRSWMRFFAQSLGDSAPRMSAARPSDFLERYSDSGPEDAALIDLRRKMMSVSRGFMATAGAWTAEQTLAPEAQQVVEALESLAHNAGPLKPLFGDQHPTYVERANQAARSVRSFIEQTQTGASAEEALRGVVESCKACHESEFFGQSLQDFARLKRTERGFGDGLYRLGFDLFATTEDPQLEQALAQEVRHALLLLDALTSFGDPELFEVGDPRISGRGIEPYENSWSVTKILPHGEREDLGRRTDRLEVRQEAGRELLVRLQEDFSPTGQSTGTHEHVADRATLAPVRMRATKDGESVAEVEYGATSVQGAFFLPSQDAPLTLEGTIPVAGFDWNLFGILIRGFPLQPGFEARFRYVDFAMPEGSASTPLLRTQALRVVREEELLSRTGSGTPTLVVECPGTRGDFTLWISSSPPYVLQADQELPDGSRMEWRQE